jgi:hypothetical protein
VGGELVFFRLGRISFFIAVATVGGCKRDRVEKQPVGSAAGKSAKGPAHEGSRKPGKAGTAKALQRKSVVKIMGFDHGGEPEIRLESGGSIRVMFDYMPPSFHEGNDLGPYTDFDKQMKRAIGVDVKWEDREVFYIARPKQNTVGRIKKFLENYKHPK